MNFHIKIFIKKTRITPTALNKEPLSNHSMTVSLSISGPTILSWYTSQAFPLNLLKKIQILVYVRIGFWITVVEVTILQLYFCRSRSERDER